jgi:flagellar protein FlbD
MIMLTRLNGPAFALNPDLIERAEATPDTVITLVDGTRYLVAESLPEVIEKVRWARACVLATASSLQEEAMTEPGSHGHGHGDGDDDGPATRNSDVIPLRRNS